MNVDVGGGTSKIAVCADGKVIDVTALDVGARLVCLDADGRIVRVEEAGRRYGAELGLDLELGGMLTLEQGARPRGADGGPAVRGDARRRRPRPAGVGLLRTRSARRRDADRSGQFSGGVSEYIYGNEAKTFGDLGPLLAQEIRARVDGLGPAARALDRRHPRHRGRRLAIHHPGERQHDLCRRRSTPCRCATCR